MNEIELVKIINGNAYTTTRKIAEKFGKQHKNVLRDIEKLVESGGSDLRHQMFIESTYKNRGKEYKEYFVSQDGLTLYLFNIQGFVAEKMEYINAFNKMKQLITDLQLGKPEAIMGLLTWKNSNMETTIRTYVNGTNVLNVLPAIAEECKKQVMSGETKLDVLAVAIRTARAMRDEEENLAYRDLYNQAIEKAAAIKEKILISRMGGIATSKAKLEDKCKRLQEGVYEDDDFFDFLNVLVEDKAVQIYKQNMPIFVSFIAEKTGKTHQEVYKAIYTNVTNYNGLFVPTVASIKDKGYKSLLQYFYATYGMNLLNQFAAEAQRWIRNLNGGNII